jgi:hypothetical protein
VSGRLRIALTRLPRSVCWTSPSGTICGLASHQGLRGASLCPIRSPQEQQIAKIVLTSVLWMRRAIPVAVEGGWRRLRLPNDAGEDKGCQTRRASEGMVRRK